MEGNMRKTRISIAVLAAFALGSAAPMFAQGANDDPSKEPPAGGRIPASADTPQHSGDTSSDQPSRSDTTSQSGQSGQSGSTSTGQAGQDQAAPSQRDATKAQTGNDPTGQQDQSGQGSAQGQSPSPGGSQGNEGRTRDKGSQQEKWQTQDQVGMQQDGSPGAQYRHDGMQQRWNDPQQMGWGREGRTSRYPQFQGGPQDDYYGGDRIGAGPDQYRYEPRARYYDRDRYAQREYRQRYRDDDRDWNALGEFGSQRGARDRGNWGWAGEEEGSGYTYRDRDDYYAGRDYDYPRSYRGRQYRGPEDAYRSGERMGRGPAYYEDYYGDSRDPYRYRDQWQGDRYSDRWQGNQWRDRQDMAGRWDSRNQRRWPDERGMDDMNGRGAGNMDYYPGEQGGPQWQGRQYPRSSQRQSGQYPDDQRWQQGQSGASAQGTPPGIAAGQPGSPGTQSGTIPQGATPGAGTGSSSTGTSQSGSGVK
jgi:hypothetical protein